MFNLRQRKLGIVRRRKNKEKSKKYTAKDLKQRKFYEEAQNIENHRYKRKVHLMNTQASKYVQ